MGIGGSETLAGSVSPALRLLAATCRWPGGAERDAAVRAAAKGFADWSAFLRLVGRHRVPGLVQDALAGAGIAVPDWLKADLAGKVRNIRFHNMRCAAETAKLQQQLDAAGVPVVFFKGVTLGARAYDSIGLKHGKDVDCLIPEAEVERTVALLLGQGYTLMWPRAVLTRRQLRALLRADKELILLNPAGVQVELHWRVTDNTQLFPPNRLLAAAVPETARIGAQQIRGLDPADEFAYLCVHGLDSGWSRLKWLADVNALIAPLPPETRVQLWHDSAARGSAFATAVALVLCETWFGTAAPAQAHAQLAESRLARAMLALSMTNLRAPTSALPWYRDAAMHLMLAVPHRDLLAQMGRVTIAVDDVMRFPLPRPLYFLYPLVLRIPFALLRKYRKRRAEGRPVATAQRLA